MERSDFLVSAKWLNEHLQDENLVIVDCHWDSNAYLRAHISRAKMRPGHPYVKSEPDGKVSKFLPTEQEFSRTLSQLEIGSNTLVVCYDEWSNHFATRFWWVVSYFGHRNVKLLDGGWQAWVNAGFPISYKDEGYVDHRTNFKSQVAPKLNIEMPEVSASIGQPEWQILDVRSEDEYRGVNLAGNKRGGHIRGAIHLEWSTLLTDPDLASGIRFFQPFDEMQDRLDKSGLDKEKYIVVHCQSGVRASFMVFCLTMLGYTKVRLYDGSMGEWANTDAELVQ